MTDERTYQIPIENMPKLEERFVKINRKAKKLGFAPISYTKIKDHYNTFIDEVNRIELKRHYVEISVHGETPKISGWTFLGSLDHSSIQGSVLIRSIPGVQMPEQFRNSDTTCDHCNKKRVRHNTFVLEKDGEYKRVGSACTKDFLGHDPKKIAAYLEMQFSIDELIEEYTGGNAFDHMIDVIRLLAITHVIIKDSGWVSHKAADERGTTPTSSLVWSYLFSSDRYWKDFREENPVTNDHYAEAEKAIEWVHQQEANNDYMHNIKSIVEGEVVSQKTIGFTASIMGSYLNSLKKEAEKVEVVNEYVGEIKKRQKMKLTLIFERFYDNDFGGSTLHKFVDDGGRLITWWASRTLGLTVGNTYDVKATVKEHTEYEGTKQTVVSRVALDEGAKEGVYKGYKFTHTNSAYTYWAYKADENGEQISDTIYGMTKVDLFQDIDAIIANGEENEQRTKN